MADTKKTEAQVKAEQEAAEAKKLTDDKKAADEAEAKKLAEDQAAEAARAAAETEHTIPMIAPANCGPVSIGGRDIPFNKETGVCMIPAELVETAKTHGFTLRD
jgi:hypothetical protein